MGAFEAGAIERKGARGWRDRDVVAVLRVAGDLGLVRRLVFRRVLFLRRLLRLRGRLRAIAEEQRVRAIGRDRGGGVAAPALVLAAVRLRDARGGSVLDEDPL